MVERDTFISFATCAIDLLPSFIMSSARAACSADSALFLPPFRPRALAAASSRNAVSGNPVSITEPTRLMGSRPVRAVPGQ
jgi:hypothetical protein